MEIEWKSQSGSPFIFKHFAEWPGLRIHRAHVKPGRMLEHANAFHEINVSLAGKLTTERHTATGRRVCSHSSRNNLCITPAGQSISAYWNRPIDNLGMSLDKDFAAQAALENGFSTNFEFIETNGQSDRLIQSIGLSLLDSSVTDSPVDRLYADSLINSLTLHLLANYSTAKAEKQTETGGLSGYKFRRVTEYLEAHLDDDISLNEIAAIADLSPSHFSRAFRKTTGQSPIQYLMQRRLERAKELLAVPEIPLVEVGLLSGFKNQSHFSTLFRKYTRLTPRGWRDAKLA
jgi:AraC family transcriptional regulator